MGRASRWVEAVVLGQRGHMFPRVPVLLACGIGTFFLLRFEPAPAVLLGVAGGGLAGVTLQRWLPPVLAIICLAVALWALGFALAGARAHQVAAPVLDFRYYGPVEGRIVAIDRSGSDAVRLTLDRVVLERMAPQDTPARVRVSLHGAQGFTTPQPGATVILTGHLSAPGGAVEPGGFDLRRHAWFQQLGAVGYTRTPMLLLHPPDGALPVFALRMAISARLQAALPGETGAFAAAVTAGDRSGMGQDTLQALRDTNLAHLLAISGLHMGLLAGFVFATLRVGLVLIPHVGLRWPVKKIAAGGALTAAAGYLALSGGNVATERAFVMVAVALVAVMLDRRALSLRAVAMAALIVLMLRPEALLGPGFQMSFAATTALVAVFAVLRDLETESIPRWARPFMGLVISSAVAGLATAPVALAHFNQMAHYGLLANLMSVPMMGLVVVPGAVAAALLSVIGLEWVALWGMGLGLDWILGVARTIAAWDGAVGPVVAPPGAVLPVLSLGALFVCLWQGRARALGLVPVALAIGLWTQAERPAVLVADNGALIGVMTEDGRGLSKTKGSGFVARVWLENDGRGGTQESAAANWPGKIEDRVARARLGGGELLHVQGKRAGRALAGCTPGDVVVSSAPLRLTGGCRVFDPDSLRQTGSVAIFDTPEGLRFETARDRSGQRLWSLPPRNDRRLAARAGQ
ncbi:ComEC/Rec2 family competence protein [Aestuariicoccus sp. MJ-SS9]|uniref:ComEC/Rec2 family competence protein n=1 Tax=Aestuariicoccus sp. MJ-SS9 TaxID=3079855 RepID=UPI002908106F|nr:ComEC/Rec2 family competence protein [Aestuariicoccus sp. MJ-SS9]MDU8911482.1 ComEC/Rec2 family competence protein [Aestuariicoccus sp. MJ-SS9]